MQVKDAHPLVPISPRDWHLPACRGEKGKLCANTSGTFAVGVLAEQGRHSSGPRRALPELASWPLLDDLTVLILHDMTCESVLLVLTYLRILVFPLSWKKPVRGETLQWVGYELLLKNAAPGLSASRAVHPSLAKQSGAAAVCSVRVRSARLRLPVLGSPLRQGTHCKVGSRCAGRHVTLEHRVCRLQRQRWTEAWQADETR